MYLNQPVSYNEIPKAFLPKNQGIFVSEDMLETNGDGYFLQISSHFPAYGWKHMFIFIIVRSFIKVTIKIKTLRPTGQRWRE